MEKVVVGFKLGLLPNPSKHRNVLCFVVFICILYVYCGLFVCLLWFVFHHKSCVQINSPSIMEPFILWLPLLACCVTLVWCPVAFRLSITAARPEYSLTGLIQYGNTISSVAVMLLSVDFCRAGF